MTDEQKKWFHASIDQITGTISLQPAFQEDNQLKALYVVLHATSAAMVFGEIECLARTCADWCHRKADESDQFGGFSPN